MKRSFIHVIVVLTVLLTMSACSRVNNSSYLQSRNNAYLASTNAPPLVVPPPLSKNKLKDTYVLPNPSGEPGAGDAPPGVVTATGNVRQQPVYLPGISAAKIKSTAVDNHPALLLKEPLAQSWLIVGSGLRRQKIPVLQMNVATQVYVIKAQQIYQVRLQQYSDSATLIHITKHDGSVPTDALSASLLATLSRGMQGKSTNFWSSIL